MSTHEQILRNQSRQKLAESSKRLSCENSYAALGKIDNSRKKAIRKLVRKIDGRAKRVSQRLRLLGKGDCRLLPASR